MSAIELFFDESGSISANKHSRMVVGGIAIKADCEADLKVFHDAVYSRLKESNYLAGICDREGRSHNHVKCPEPGKYLPKGPRVAEAAVTDRNAHWEKVGAAASSVAEISGSGVSIAAFALSFPSNVQSLIKTTPKEMECLTDASYLDRFEDLLEFILFEWDFVAAELKRECQLLVNAPTRVATLDTSGLQQLKAVLENEWGHSAFMSGGKLFCDTLQRSDAIGILQSAVARRRRQWELSAKAKVSRCCACKLMDWDSWRKLKERDANLASSGRAPKGCENYFKHELRPRQMHYFADFVCSGVYQGRFGKSAKLPPFDTWFERGFILDFTDSYCDPWLAALRAYSNGDHVAALCSIYYSNALSGKPQNLRVFKERSSNWGEELTGEEYRSLFHRLADESSTSSGEHHPIKETRDTGECKVIVIRELPQSLRNMASLKSSCGPIVSGAKVSFGWNEQNGCFACLCFESPSAASDALSHLQSLDWARGAALCNE